MSSVCIVGREDDRRTRNRAEWAAASMRAYCAVDLKIRLHRWPRSSLPYQRLEQANTDAACCSPAAVQRMCTAASARDITPWRQIAPRAARSDNCCAALHAVEELLTRVNERDEQDNRATEARSERPLLRHSRRSHAAPQQTAESGRCATHCRPLAQHGATQPLKLKRERTRVQRA